MGIRKGDSMAVQKVLGIGWGNELAKALGLEGKKVSAIDLRIRPREVVTATVEMYVCQEQADAVLTVLESYHLERVAEQASREVQPGEDVTTLADSVLMTAPLEKSRMMEFFKRENA